MQRMRIVKQKAGDSREDVFQNLPVLSALRVMVVPAVTSQLIVLIYNMADTFYVGQTNNPYMVASTSLILPVFNITLCLAGLAGIGGGALISRLLGQDDPDEARRVGAFSLYLGALIAAVFAIGMGKGSIITFSPRAGLPRRENVIAVFAVGVPSAIAAFLFDMDYVIIDKLMVSYGDLALAAVGIVLKVKRFPLNVGIGICQGMLPLVAYNCAAQNKQRMEDTIRLARTLGLIIAGASVVLYELFAVQFTRLFISDPQTLEMAAQFLRIRVLATPLMFLSFFTVYLFQSFGKGRFSLFLGVTRWLVFNIPMLFLLNAVFGMYGIVWSQAAADILTVALSFFVYHKYRPRFTKTPGGYPPGVFVQIP